MGTAEWAKALGGKELDSLEDLRGQEIGLERKRRPMVLVVVNVGRNRAYHPSVDLLHSLMNVLNKGNFSNVKCLKTI